MRGRVANAARSPSIVSHSSFGRQGADRCDPSARSFRPCPRRPAG